LSLDVHPTIFAQSDRESDRFGIIRPKSDHFNGIHQSIRPKIFLIIRIKLNYDIWKENKRAQRGARIAATSIICGIRD